MLADFHRTGVATGGQIKTLGSCKHLGLLFVGFLLVDWLLGCCFFSKEFFGFCFFFQGVVCVCFCFVFFNDPKLLRLLLQFNRNKIFGADVPNQIWVQIPAWQLVWSYFSLKQMRRERETAQRALTPTAQGAQRGTDSSAYPQQP